MGRPARAGLAAPRACRPRWCGDRPARAWWGPPSDRRYQHRHHHGPMLRRGGDAPSDFLFEEIGATLGELIGRDNDRSRRRQQRPAHRVLCTGSVDEDEAVEAVEPLFRVAGGPGPVLGPVAERRELRMCRSESRHRVRVLAPRRAQQFVEGLWCRHREDRGVDHGTTPFLSVRRRDPYSQATHPDGRVRRVRICGSQVEAPEHRIFPARQNRSLRKLGSGPVCFEDAGKADPLGMVAAVTERHPGWRRKRSDKLPRREALRRKPSCRIGKRCGTGADDDGNQRQWTKRGRLVGRCHLTPRWLGRRAFDSAKMALLSVRHGMFFKAAICENCCA